LASALNTGVNVVLWQLMNSPTMSLTSLKLSCALIKIVLLPPFSLTVDWPHTSAITTFIARQVFNLITHQTTLKLR
jgi:hypothetical protein